MVWLWQVAFALILISLFYGKQCTAWIHAYASDRRFAYVLAVAYAFAAILLINLTFTNTPLPRFDDVFIVGIALTAYFFSTGPAAFLLGIGLAVSLLVLRPSGGDYGTNPADAYRIASFAIVSVLLMFVIASLKQKVKQRSQAFPLGYAFATGYAAIATVVTVIMFHSQPLPRFMDIYLVGIAMTAYFFTVTPATYLLAISVAISAWILPPTGSFAIANPADWYRIFSFTAVALLLIFLTARLKRWSAQTAEVLSRQ